jgi:hypothetical protein
MSWLKIFAFCMISLLAVSCTGRIIEIPSTSTQTTGTGPDSGTLSETLPETPEEWPENSVRVRFQLLNDTTVPVRLEVGQYKPGIGPGTGFIARSIFENFFGSSKIVDYPLPAIVGETYQARIYYGTEVTTHFVKVPADLTKTLMVQVGLKPQYDGFPFSFGCRFTVPDSRNGCLVSVEGYDDPNLAFPCHLLSTDGFACTTYNLINGQKIKVTSTCNGLPVGAPVDVLVDDYYNEVLTVDGCQSQKTIRFVLNVKLNGAPVSAAEAEIRNFATETIRKPIVNGVMEFDFVLTKENEGKLRTLLLNTTIGGVNYFAVPIGSSIIKLPMRVERQTDYTYEMRMERDTTVSGGI